MRDYIRRRPVTSFFITAVLFGTFAILIRGPSLGFFNPFIAWLAAQHLPGNFVTVLVYSLDHPWFALTLLFPLAPTLAAIAVTAIGWGRSGLLELFSRLKPWRDGVGWRRGLQVYGVITAVYLTIALVLMVRSYHLGNTAGLDTLSMIIGTTPFAMLTWLALLPYVDGGALSEELGWRGYALPRLMEVMRTPLAAAVVLGVLWGVWHMPRDLPVFLSGAAAFDARFGGIDGYLIEWTNFVLGTIGSTILCAYVFNLTGGSVIAPILVHGASNTIKVNILRFTGDRTFEWQGFQVDITDLFLIPIVLAVLLLAGPQLGRRSKTVESH